jgi:hypothetical protein
MSIFDLLFSTSSKKIYGNKFRKALRGISELSEKERTYVREAFKNDLKGGLSKFEIKKRCASLMHKSGDPLEPLEVKKIKEKLLKYFDK